MAHRIFVSHLGQGEATIPYGYSTAAKNKACQLVKKKKKKEKKREILVNRASHWDQRRAHKHTFVTTLLLPMWQRSPSEGEILHLSTTIYSQLQK